MRRTLFPLLFFLLVLPMTATAHQGLTAEEAELNDALAKSPSDAALLLRRAELRRRQERYDPALADLERVRKLRPDDATVDLLAGRTLLEKGATAKAIARLDAYLGERPDSFRAHWLRGAAHERIGNYREARRDYDAAVSEGDSIELYVARARVLVRMGLEAEAAANLRRGLRRMNGAVVLRLELIELEAKRGRYAAVIEAIEPALRKARVKTDWLLRRADAYEAMGRSKDAMADRKAALMEAKRLLKRRRSPAALLRHGRALMALERHAEALPSLREAVKRAPRLSHGNELLQRAKRTSEEVNR